MSRPRRVSWERWWECLQPNCSRREWSAEAPLCDCVSPPSRMCEAYPNEMQTADVERWVRERNYRLTDPWGTAA